MLDQFHLSTPLQVLLWQVSLGTLADMRAQMVERVETYQGGIPDMLMEAASETDRIWILRR